MNTIVFVDGQNLYRQAKNAWLQSVGTSSRYTYPCYDVALLAAALAARTPGRTLVETHFYTGVPTSRQNARWCTFWKNKLPCVESQGIKVYKGHINSAAQEKGVDVKLSVDLIQFTYERRYDLAIIVSQDRDFAPAIQLAKRIACDQGRQLTFESCFPVGPGTVSTRGIPGTTWVQIDKATYDACEDPADYR